MKWMAQISCPFINSSTSIQHLLCMKFWVQSLLIYLPCSQRIPRLEEKEMSVDELLWHKTPNTKTEVCPKSSAGIEQEVQKKNFIAGDI